MDNQNNFVPLEKKITLTIAEAALLSGIAMKDVRRICYNHPEVCLKVGSSEKRHPKTLVKRRKFENLIEELPSIE